MNSLLCKKQLACVLIVILVLSVGCKRRDKQSAEKESTKPANSSGQQWVDPANIERGPLRHETLTDEQLERIKALHQTFGEVDRQDAEQWIDDFKRDLNPEQEIAVWERMATAYNGFCKDRQLTLEHKREAFKVVLLRSMTTQDQVLARVDLKLITRDDAIEIMTGY